MSQTELRNRKKKFLAYPEYTDVDRRGRNYAKLAFLNIMYLDYSENNI